MPGSRPMEIIATSVGIDVCKDRLDVFIEGPKGGRRQFANDSEGIRKLIAQLGSGCVVAMEATGRYEAQLRHALEAAGLDVRVQNPRLVRRLAEGLGVQAKTDLIDAQL